MKIAIAGYGVEGEASLNYWLAQGENELTVFDQKPLSIELPAGVRLVTGAAVFGQLDGYDMVVRTPSLSPSSIKTDGKVWSATNEFFDKCPAPIIGVTGSKGKGTTASLIANILRKAGKTVWLVGNIGQPALTVFEQIKASDVVVYELSSFQLWDLGKSPHVAVVLFIEQEHLDVHSSMDEYVLAKANIAKYQTEADVLVYNQNNSYARGIASKSKAQTVGYPDVKTAHIKDDAFYYGEQKICSVDSLRIAGPHNRDNACAAIDAVWPYTKDADNISAGLAAFHGLPHRLEYVDEVGGVKYYDDSIATTPSSAIAALRTFDQPKVIILGGSSKGSDFTELAKELKKHDVRAILIGNEAVRIADACEVGGFSNYEIMTEPTATRIVRRASQIAKPGSVVLLSPASASFGLFKNYADRGEQFSRAVGELEG
ncbi:UDP-N-acetylmuramoyl-L-alanine--D-glutamate ligase [Candidatus Saccharibacteria bacterium]|nr:UDP-N-acetylmuramoyl-L-alanine--D-glutamate ligase [Candidatus Saccharibacteria bacterium]